MKTFFFTGFILLIFVFACENSNSEKVSSQPKISRETAADSIFPITINLKKVFADTANSGLKSSVVNVKYDHFFKSEKSYLTFSLNEILNLHLPEEIDPAKLSITFVCTDGYKPTMTLDQVRLKEGYIAYKDLDTPEGQNWPDSLTKKFNPYYVVWEEIPYDNTDFAWPYGLAEITINHFKDEFAGAYPTDPSIVPGFLVFQKKCMKCHSINAIGGIMGPEMNYPKNITEYWKKEDIWGFATAPTSYRYNSKMAPIQHLTEDEFELIYTYLTYIKEFKEPNF